MSIYATVVRSVFILIFILNFISCSTIGKENVQQFSMNEDKIFEKGCMNIARQYYEQANKNFQIIQAKYPYGRVAKKSQLSIIYTYYKQGNLPEALSAANYYIKLHPKDIDADYAYYMKGLILYENTSDVYRYFPLDKSKRDPSEAKQSFNTFKKLLMLYPQSKYVTNAKQYMIQLYNQLAKYELNISQYYLEQDVYLAAANRANHIITTFSYSSSMVPQALKIMILTYKNLDIQNLEI